MEHLTHILNNLSSLLSERTVTDYLVNMSEGKEEFHSPVRMSFPYEKHKYYEIAIQISGTSIIEMENHIYKLKELSIILVNREKEHKLSIPIQKEKCLMLWINATNETLRLGISAYNGDRRLKEWALDISAPGAFFIGEILDELQLTPRSNKTIAKYLSVFLMMVSRKLSFFSEAYKSSRKNTIIANVKKYVKLHIHDRISLEDLADYASVSTNYLCSLFKQMEGETIKTYVHDAKIKSSIPRLLDADKTLQNVAEDFGYYDQFHYSRTFKKFMGMSPASYRSTFKK